MAEGTLLRFPNQTLKPAGGEIQATITENPMTGLKRGLFWRFTVKFEPFEYRGEKVSPSMTISGVRLPIRDWRELVGTKIQGEYGQDDIESSFYVWSHDVAPSFTLEVIERKENAFRVAIRMIVEFSGSDSTDADPRMPVEADCWLPFRGLVVAPELLPSKDDRRAAREIAAQHVDLSTYLDLETSPRRFTPRIHRDAAVH